MKTTSVDNLRKLQKQPSSIRNICILAHVDHGKTTLADALVASNGIISQRMAGKLRYLDSREDEQTRGITMKSSAISLYFSNDEKKEFLINLIDSPGHVDFSSEVSTAVRLCDGAVVIIDVVEGVCPQTHAVLRQAWLENIKPILVLNKIDRLILELKMDPVEAYLHLQQILVEVNVVTSELFTADMMSLQTTENDNSTTQTHDWTEDADELEHKNIYFSPDQGNVVFACAYDGWGFTINQFAEIFSKKLGMNKEGLQTTLWGDYFLNSKTKRIMKGAQSKGKKPLFVQFILESIWSVYNAIMVSKDKEKIEKIVGSLGLKILPRDVRSNDTRVHLQAVMSQWLPVAKAVLDVVTDKLPSPLNILDEKVEKLMCNQASRFDSLPQQTQNLKSAFLACDSSAEAPVIVFVSKMFPVDRSALPQNKQRPLTEDELQKRRTAARERHAAKMAAGADDNVTVEATGVDEGTAMSTNENVDSKSEDNEDAHQQAFVAFARVYSGTVKSGQKIYVLGPKHDPAKVLHQLQDGCTVDTSLTVGDLASDDHMTVATATDLYLFMGRELESLDSVPAGNVLGIGGLENHILKSATLSSTVACPAFTDLYFDAFPILRVALEPSQAGDMGRLVKGLRLLNQADPCVQVLVQETGEHVIVTAGEVHLRRCLDDLEQRYAGVKVTASAPIVPFRETIVPPPTTDMVNESIQDQSVMKNERKTEWEDDDEVLAAGVTCVFTPNHNCMVQLRALPLPPEVTNFLEDNQFLIKTLDLYMSSKLFGRSKGEVQEGSKLKESTKESILEFRDNLDKKFLEAGKKWAGFVDLIWAFGPKRVGPNLLVNKVEGYNRTCIWDCLKKGKDTSLSVRDNDFSIISGFQLTTLTGPLCAEPMRGVCFIVEKWEIAPTKSQQEDVLLTNIKHKNPADCSELGSQLSKMSVNSHGCHSDNGISSNPKEVDSKDIKQCNGTDDEEEAEDAVNGNADSDNESTTSSRRSDLQGHSSGQLISITKTACLKAFQTQPQRLMAAMYKCNIQATAEVLGKLYGVIGKRAGRILNEDMKEGSQMFNVEATIPVVESFGFCDDIRKKTSGLASPQLLFSHWEVIDVDPFWVPTTEEEIMHYGEKADSENRARAYMNDVRKRKGLKVDKKIVEHAEKQRTLTRNK